MNAYSAFHMFVLQALSLFLLSAYYKILGCFPLVAVAALLLYVGCYQASLFSFGCVTQVYFSCNYRMEYWHSIIFGLQKLIEYSIRCCSHYPTAPFKRRKRRKRRN